jgi:hypothetical protein
MISFTPFGLAKKSCSIFTPVFTILPHLKSFCKHVLSCEPQILLVLVLNLPLLKRITGEMDYIKLHGLLKSKFDLRHEVTEISELDLAMRLLLFKSSPGPKGFDRLMLPRLRKYFGYDDLDNRIPENCAFKVPVFIPKHSTNRKKVIVLLHGLNERSWYKYLPWAAYLAYKTKRPVLAFPISFHMNRAPSEWTNRFSMKHLLEKRKAVFRNDLTSCSFLNVALSERLTEHPERFLTSGLQTIVDLLDLLRAIHKGEYSWFERGTTFDFFSYSIGGLISQVLMLANPLPLLPDAKHFLFCSGCLLEDMNGISKSILDSKASERLKNFYLEVLPQKLKSPGIIHDFFGGSSLGKAFQSLISDDVNKEQREFVFAANASKIRVISLYNDTVMPYYKVEKTFGPKKSAEVQVLDFDYSYTHEIPFPVLNKKIIPNVNRAFEEVFSDAADFLL